MDQVKGVLTLQGEALTQAVSMFHNNMNLKSAFSTNNTALLLLLQFDFLKLMRLYPKLSDSVMNDKIPLYIIHTLQD